MSMQFRTWFVGLAVVGGAAGAAAALLVWLLVTEPFAVARLIVGGL